jgi:hypothetical protein
LKISLDYKVLEMDVVVHACNLSTWDIEARGLQVQNQPELHSKILFQTSLPTKKDLNLRTLKKVLEPFILGRT